MIKPETRPLNVSLTKGFDLFSYFQYIGNMKINSAVKSLSALAQETRLSIFKLLVQAGEVGLSAGQIAKSLSIPNATLSFHLKELSHAGLVIARQEGRFIYYNANFAAMNDLLGFLTENCCAGIPCTPDLDCCESERVASQQLSVIPE